MKRSDGVVSGMEIAEEIATVVMSAGFLITAITVAVRISAKWSKIEARQDALSAKVADMATEQHETRLGLLAELTRVNDRLWQLARPDLSQRGT